LTTEYPTEWASGSPSRWNDRIYPSVHHLPFHFIFLLVFVSHTKPPTIHTTLFERSKAGATIALVLLLLVILIAEGPSLSLGDLLKQ
jgi:hypothetical protein